jgi:glutathione S-transferase
MEKLELVSRKLCPFVQRAAIVLNHKNANYKITYVDLEKPPEWFNEISPLKKVPLLKIGENDVLFESAVICEYIDDVTPSSIRPENALQLAYNRAWIEFGSTCIIDQYLLLLKKTEQEFKEQADQIADKLRLVENKLDSLPFFNGETFSLVDATYAPLFIRYEIINNIIPIYTTLDFKKLSTWSKSLLELSAVQTSKESDFNTQYINKIKNFDGYLSSRIR